MLERLVKEALIMSHLPMLPKDFCLRTWKAHLTLMETFFFINGTELRVKQAWLWTSLGHEVAKTLLELAPVRTGRGQYADFVKALTAAFRKQRFWPEED